MSGGRRGSGGMDSSESGKDPIHSLQRIGHPKPAKDTKFCSVKAQRTGRTFLQQPKMAVEWSIAWLNRKAAVFLNWRPLVGAWKRFGQSIEADWLAGSDRAIELSSRQQRSFGIYLNHCHLLAP